MALVKCTECGSQVSTEAKACPSCGARPPKRTSLVTWIVGGIFAVAVANIVISTTGSPPISTAPPPTPEQSAALERAQQDAGRSRQHEALRAARARAVVGALREAARNPASFMVERVIASDDGSVVCVQYRAQNGFGGMNREVAVFDGSKPGTTDTAVVNRKCQVDGLRDLTSLVG